MNRSSLFVILCTFLIKLTIFVTKVESADDKKFMVCYVSSWSTYRKPSFTPAQIDPTVCTHIVYAFAGLKKDTADSIVSLSGYTDLTDNYGLGYYSKVTGLKERYPHLKVLLSIGGWNEGSINYSKLAQSKDKRRSFATSVIAHLSKYNFDGLDIYWQYPAKRGGIPEDKDNFPLLLRDLRDEFDKNDYLLTVFLSSTKTNIDAGYDLPAIAQMVDWINLHSFSFGTPWDKKFGISSPLESKSEYNVKFSVNYYLEHGVPNNKLVLIFSTHGYGYKDTDSPGKTDGISGIYNEDKGFLAFHEVCKYLQDDTSGWTETWDESSLTPVAVKKSCSCKISYDDQRSMMLKAKFAIEKNLKGLGVWTLDTDDYGGVCSLSGSGNTENGSKFPLVRALNQELRGQPTVVIVNEDRINEIDKSPSNIEVNVIVHSYN